MALEREFSFDSDLPSDTKFAELVLPVPIPKLFTYRVPRTLHDSIKAGQRAIVQFGQKKILTGIIHTIHHNPPQEYEAKYILELLDENEVITAQQFKFYQWMADYYMCTLGEVIQAALPSGFKLSSESMVQMHPSFHLNESNFDFSEKEQLLLNHLKSEAMSYTDVTKLLGVKNIYSILKSLSSKESILLFEQVRERYRPKTERRIKLTDQFIDKKSLSELFEKLSTKPKQEAVVLRYLQDVPVFSHPELNVNGVSKSQLIKEDISESSIGTLVKQGVFEEFDLVLPRFGFADAGNDHRILLSERQEEARNSIIKHFEEKDIVLLHGVTGSGKTEIYIDLIRRALDSGSQALYLLPEIALTTQIVHRLKKVFGSELGVYHSKFSDNERVEVWNGVLQGKFKFVVGVRSSVFLPFDNLGLIIIDEEHDSSYKQHEPAPRYNARDAALVIAHFQHAKVVLGSATPSVESFYNVSQNKIGLVALTERFGNAQLPEIILADSIKEKQRKTNKGDFSSLLLHEVKEAITKNEQVILFQNRRGHSPMVQCEDCSWIPKCINCAVSLTYHQYRHALICHYCGYREELPKQCPTCSSKRILTMGYGTERLEEELKLHFPDAKIQRMDLDTTRSKTGYETIIDDFERGETHILVGTQMVTKGLDFNRVSLVGIFDADRMMHFPDFRSYERSFQLITQVSGRAGRREKRGKVVIQTSQTQHPLFTHVLENDVTGFIQEQLRDRQAHFYPPYSRLIEIIIKHTDKKITHEAAHGLADELRNQMKGVTILGPGEPMISKIRNEFLMSILVKIPRDRGRLHEIKSAILLAADQITASKQYRNVRIVFDVDPV